jgi:hypothetical protein
MSRLTQIAAQGKSAKFEGLEVGSHLGLEQDLHEASLEGIEVERCLEDCSQLSNVVAGLEAIAVAAASTIEDGGLDRNGAALLHVGVESLMSPLGIQAEEVVASMEAFGGDHTRIESTQVSVESIKSKAKDVWAWLVAQFTKVKEFVNKWYLKLFSGAKKLGERAKAVAKKANDVKGSTADADDIKLGSMAKSLHIDGKVENIGTGVASFKTFASKVFVDSHITAMGAVDAAVTALKDVDPKDLSKSTVDFSKVGDPVKTAVAAARTMTTELGATKTAPSGFTSGEGTEIKASDEYMGGKVIIAVSPSSAVAKATVKENVIAGAAALANSSHKFLTKDSKKDVDTDLELSPLNGPAIVNIAEDIVDIADAIYTFEKKAMDMNKKTDKLLSELKKYSAKAEKEDFSSLGKAMDKSVVSTFKYVAKVPGNPQAQFAQSVLQACAAALSVCEKSLAAHKE